MKVQGSAFYFGQEADSPTAKFGPFFQWLQAQPAGTSWPPHKPFLPGYAYRREIFCNTLDDLYCGVVLSARATDFHHYINRSGKTVKVEARSVGANPPVEVNFFCLRRNTGKGLYSHYYGSYAFGNFLSDLWGGYRSFVEVERQTALAGITDEDEKDGVRSAYSLHRRAQYSPLYNPRDFERLIRELTEVLEVRLTTYQVTAPGDQPVSNRISNVHSVYRLKDAQRVDQQFIQWIKSKRQAATRALKSGKPSSSGSVLGVDSSGEEKTIFFESTMDDMLNFDYDNIGSFDVTNVAANPCLAAMIATVRSGVMFR
jgi:hypothetical protein